MMDSVVTYFNLIIGHERTINDVPRLYRAKVIDLLKASGYDKLTHSDESVKTWYNSGKQYYE